MPSPFPGMDPWLEYPSLWPDVHRNLISVCQELLVPLVAPHFYVRGEAWLFNLPDRLPVISVPLRPPHPDVALDLQKALDTVYDRAGYGFSIDYTQPPEPPLPTEMAAWAEALLEGQHIL